VSWTENEGTQNQHVQRALQEFNPLRGFVWHISADILPNVIEIG
jgi:hypothetical protein